MLVGVPLKEFKMIKQSTGEEKWVAEKLLDKFSTLGYHICEDCASRMSYSIPSWVPKDDVPSMLVLDDFSRGHQMFMNAIMELIDRGEYLSWKLPKNCHLFLTSNYDNGEYSVTSSLDEAQKTRMVTFNLGFDIEPYVKWMDQQQMDSRLINFAYLFREIFDRPCVNPRSYTMFTNSLSSIKDFNKDLSLVNLITKGAFNDEDDTISTMFIQFLNNNLDKLIDPKDILKGDWDKVSVKIEDSVYRDGQYRPDIASVITTRLCTFIEDFFQTEKDNKATEKLCARLIDIIDYPKTLLSEDIMFRLLKYLTTKYSARCTKLTLNPKIRKKLLL